LLCGLRSATLTIINLPLTGNAGRQLITVALFFLGGKCENIMEMDSRLRGNDKSFMDQQTQKNLLALVKKNYEQISVDFDVTRKKQLWPELLKLAEPVKDGDKILDVGCGNGRLIEAFMNKKVNYLGVDNSEKLIENAKKNLDSRLRGNDKWEAAARNNNSSYEFKIADVLELDKLPEHDFDYIFCIAVLHHLPGEDLQAQALEQMKDKIKPASAGSARGGGKIILTVWNLWGQPKFRKLIFKYGWLKLVGKNKMDFNDILFDWKNNKGEQISRRYYHAFIKNELKKLAVRAGLKIEKLYKDKYNYYLTLEK